MLAGADDLAGLSALAVIEGPRPAEAETREGGRREDADEGHRAWVSVGALAEEIVNRIRDRATRTEPREMARAPAGEVARAGRRCQYWSAEE